MVKTVHCKNPVQNIKREPEKAKRESVEVKLEENMKKGLAVKKEGVKKEAVKKEPEKVKRESVKVKLEENMKKGLAVKKEEVKKEAAKKEQAKKEQVKKELTVKKEPKRELKYAKGHWKVRAQKKPALTRGDSERIRVVAKKRAQKLLDLPGKWMTCPACAWARWIPDTGSRQLHCQSYNGGFKGEWRCGKQPTNRGWARSSQLPAEAVKNHNNAVKKALRDVQLSMDPPGGDKASKIAFLLAVRRKMELKMKIELKEKPKIEIQPKEEPK